MSHKQEYSAEEVSQALSVLDDYIESLILDISKNQIDDTGATQLKEISKAIERLEKQKITVPDSLLNERSKLLSLVAKPHVSSDLINDIYFRLNAIIGRVSIFLKESKTSIKTNASKSKRSKLAMTNHHILRECIIKSLTYLGGSAHKKDIISNIEEQLKDAFLPGDIEWREDWNCFVWQNRVNWELTEMRAKGLLKPKKQTGIWELADDYTKKG